MAVISLFNLALGLLILVSLPQITFCRIRPPAWVRPTAKVFFSILFIFIILIF